MKINHPWIWDAYLVIILTVTLRDFYALLTPQSESFFYYFILRSFNPVFYLHYSAYVIHVFLSAAHCLPLFLFIYRVRWGNTEMWKLLFVLRCVFEVIGHSYDMNVLAALYYSNNKFIWLAVSFMIVPYIPSYIACFWFAFRSNDEWPASGSLKSLPPVRRS